jgi:CheY-like chemotaxis protein
MGANGLGGAPVSTPEPERIGVRDGPETGSLVLVAEDHPVNRLLAVRLLEKLGCRVDVAANGAEAVEMSAASDYAAVFMDCQMPELDGYEATARIRRREQSTGGRVPIVAMTANTMEGDRERCIDAGMDDYLAKPLRVDELESALTRALDGSDGEDGLLDREHFDAVVGEDGREAGLVTIFVDETRDRLGRLRAAIEADDSSEVTAIAHSVKGSSASFGATRMATLAGELEHGADHGPEEQLRRLGELERVFELTAVELGPTR